MKLADKKSMDAALAAARFFLVGDEMHIVIRDEVPCGLPVPETFYDLKAVTAEPEWGVCPSCHLVFIQTAFRTVTVLPNRQGP